MRETGIRTQQARQTGAPWTETSVYHSYYLLLKLDKLGFLTQQARETGAPWTDTSVNNR